MIVFWKILIPNVLVVGGGALLETPRGSPSCSPVRIWGGAIREPESLTDVECTSILTLEFLLFISCQACDDLLPQPVLCVAGFKPTGLVSKRADILSK